MTDNQHHTKKIAYRSQSPSSCTYPKPCWQINDQAQYMIQLWPSSLINKFNEIISLYKTAIHSSPFSFFASVDISYHRHLHQKVGSSIYKCINCITKHTMLHTVHLAKQNMLHLPSDIKQENLSPPSELHSSEILCSE